MGGSSLAQDQLCGRTDQPGRPSGCFLDAQMGANLPLTRNKCIPTTGFFFFHPGVGSALGEQRGNAGELEIRAGY